MLCILKMSLESVLLKWRVFLDWAACCTRMRPAATCVATWRGLCVGELCSGWIVKKAGMARTRVGRSKHALDGVPDPCIASGTKGGHVGLLPTSGRVLCLPSSEVMRPIAKLL